MKRPKSISFSLLLFLLSLLIIHLSFSLVFADSHFEGFDSEDDDIVEEEHLEPHSVKSPPLTQSDSIPSPDPDQNPVSTSDPPPHSDLQKPSTTTFEYWDEDEFEGLPIEQPPPEPSENIENASPDIPDSKTTSLPEKSSVSIKSFTVEIISVVFLIAFTINYFIDKRENEDLALAWATKFATKVFWRV